MERGGKAHLAWLAGAFGRPLAFLIQRFMRLSARRVGLALVYHRIGDPPGDPDRELVPARGTAQFESELRHLERCYRVVPAARLLEAAAERRRGQRFPVAITFDDDLSSHVESAMPILERHGLPATFFVGGTSLNGPVTPFWWESLQAAFDTGNEVAAAAVIAQATNSSTAGERPDIRELARRIQAMGPEQREVVSAGLREVAAPDVRPLNGEELRKLASRGFEIGFHTRGHDPLPSLRDEQLGAAMVEGRDEVAAVIGRGGDPDRVSPRSGRPPCRRGGAGSRLQARLHGRTRGGARLHEPLSRAEIGPTIRSSGRGALQIALTLMALWRP